jgi:predicted phosphodiesterase
MRSLLNIADVHLADRSRADDSCEEGFLTLYQPETLGLLGDFVDGYLASWATIIERHLLLLRWLDRLVTQARVRILLLRGNHENGPIEKLLADLRLAMPNCEMVGWDGIYGLTQEQEAISLGWALCHGHQFDPWCHGPQSVLSELGAVVTGLIERIVPGFEESMVNPTRLTSPARAKRASLQTAIQERADAFVQKTGRRVVHGHTHRRRISSDGKVVCAGTCTHGRGEFAVVFENGHSVLGEMKG